MALQSVTISADSLERLTALRGRGLDLHERAARSRPDQGDYVVPAILTEEQIAQLEADGYRVTASRNANDLALERAAEVTPQTNRFAPSVPPGAERDRDRSAPTELDADRAAATLERLMDLSELDNPELDDPRPDDPSTDPVTDRGTRAVAGGYLTPDEVESALAALAAQHPSTATISPLPEPSWEGRQSSVLRLRAGTGEDRIGVLVTGGVHAREWGGSDICLAFATNLLRCYAAGEALTYGGMSFTADDVRSILETLDIWVFPSVNPDGKAYSQSVDPGQPQNLWWRKNRRTQDMPPGVAGVDLNRNFDFLWPSGIGTESNPTRSTYKGPAPFSEPESRNIRWLLDAQDHIGYFVDVHCYGELLLYSWGDDENQVDVPTQNFRNPIFDGVRGVVGDAAYKEFIPGDDQAAILDLANGMNAALQQVRGRSYTVEQAVGLYPTSATTDDYAYSQHWVKPGHGKVHGFTIEFGQEFVPPYGEMRRIMADVAAALTELCRRAAQTAPSLTNRR